MTEHAEPTLCSARQRHQSLRRAAATALHGKRSPRLQLFGFTV